jgi:DMSO/TMAO reductase YedYZ heme-binding membrane subunit
MNAPNSRKLLLGVAAFCLSLASVLWFMWAGLKNGTLGNPAADPFPDAVQRAAGVSLLLCIIGAVSIGPFWRASPRSLGALAAAPYWLTAALFIFEGRARGLIFWLGAGFIVFLLFYGVTRVWLGLHAPKVD